MPEFLKLLPPTHALEVFLGALPQTTPSVERIQTQDAMGRVLAQAVVATQDMPAFSRSTVDGYAVIAADTFGANESLPVYLNCIGEVPMGSQPGFDLKSYQTALIHTGGMLPDGADAVVMLENTQLPSEQEVEIQRAVAAFDNIIQVGEDVKTGEKVLPSGLRLRPVDLGGLLALGMVEVNVARMPKVAILSSGDEVVPPESMPGPGQVRDINSYTLRSILQQCGALPVLYGIVSDNISVFQDVMQNAYEENDMVIVTAGSSASARDLTAEVIQHLGEPGVIVHGVNIRPGKPTILAVCDGKPVIGLPGNPVSAYVIASVFAVPVVERLLGIHIQRPAPTIRAYLGVNIHSATGREEYYPVRLVPGREGAVANPIFYKSNMIFSLAKADGLIHIPADAGGMSTGTIVEVTLL